MPQLRYYKVGSKGTNKQIVLDERHDDYQGKMVWVVVQRDESGFDRPFLWSPFPSEDHKCPSEIPPYGWRYNANPKKVPPHWKNAASEVSFKGKQ